MKHLKHISALLLAAVLLLCLAAPAFAAEPSVTFGEDRVIAFAPGSAYTTTDLFANFKGVMPGDTRSQTITIDNRNAEFDYLKVYLRAVPHGADNAPQIQTETERMLDFLAQLSMQVFLGDQQIYSASPDQTDGLTEAMYLGSLAAGETIQLRAELSVPITMGNEYMGRMGEVDWQFVFEGFDVDKLTVRKLWTGDTRNHPDSVTVHLLRDGKVHDTQLLNGENQWVYTWDGLDQEHTWEVREEEIPGYTTTYKTEGNVVTISNDKPGPVDPPGPAEKVDLTVIKKWVTDGKPHPDAVNMTLYNGDKAVETVQLGEWNNWTYTWHDLDGYAAWQIIETNIPGGFTPSYWCENGVLTVTNTDSLIHTGQLQWPVPVLCGLGMVLVAWGVYLMLKKRKQDRA